MEKNNFISYCKKVISQLEKGFVKNADLDEVERCEKSGFWKTVIRIRDFDNQTFHFPICIRKKSNIMIKIKQMVTFYFKLTVDTILRLIKGEQLCQT